MKARLTVSIRQQTSTPYSQSLLGEYFRILLILVGIPLAVFWANQLPFSLNSIVFLVASIAVLFVLLIPYGAGIIRSAILLGILSTVLVFFVLGLQSQENAFDRTNGIQLILLFCLIAIALFETSFFAYQACKTNNYLFVAWCLLITGLFIYAVAIPSFNVIQESLGGEGPDRIVAKKQTVLLEELKVRGAYFGIFALFTFIGACIGSFLNVVAASVVHGKPLAMRSSACPNCGTKIRRTDNLPIYSYLNLSGRCRDCQITIPIRYLVVEMVAGLIFGSLFMYQLITGAANVPSFTHYFHTGILWMVLYPKWDVIGIYLFHTSYMSTLLTLALIEWDGRKIGQLSFWVLCVLFSVPVFFFATVQPVSFDSHIEFLKLNLSLSMKIVLKVLVGGILGIVFGFALKLLRVAGNSHAIITVCCISGIALGWQAFLHLLTAFVLCAVICQLIAPLRERIGNRRMSSVWLAAVMIHHPFWKLISELWQTAEQSQFN